MKKYYSYLILYFLLCMLNHRVHAQANDKNILFIHSYAEETNGHDHLEEGLRRGLSDLAISANIFTEHLNSESLVFAEECEAMRAICQRARENNVELIVTVSDEAFYTLMNCGDSLGYQLPIVVSAIKFPPTDLLTMNENVCGITTKIDLLPMMEEAARLFPDRKQFMCIFS